MSDPAASPTALPPTTTLDFVSTITGREYRLIITPPVGPPPPGGWPALWVLDGSGYHGLAVDLLRNIGSIGGEITPALVVAVTYPEADLKVHLTRRNLDLTPTRDATNEMAIIDGSLDDSGDLENFLTMITEEALPTVAAQFPIDRSAMALVGHSFGGLATLYALFTRPTLFASYIALCPSIWWDHRVLLKHEAAFAAQVRAGTAAPRVFIAMGGLEQTDVDVIQPDMVDTSIAKVRAVGRKARMVDNAAELAARLQALTGAPGYAVRHVCVPGETHMTTPPIVYPAALAMAFPPAIKPPLTLNDLYALDRICEAKLLPNGAGVVFVVSRSVNDVEKRDVRIVAADGSGMRTIAQDLDVCAGVSPAPDGHTLALLAVVEGKPQACLMDIDTGAIRPVTALKQGIGSPPIWSPCGGYLAFTAIGEERLPRGKFDPIRTSSLFYKLDGAGFTDRVVQDVFVVAAKWNTVTRLTRGPHSHMGLKWSPVAGRLELCFGTRGGGDLEPLSGIGIVDLAGNTRWVIENDPEVILGFGFAGDGARLVMTTALPGKAPGTATHVWTVAIADGRRECLTAAFCAATGGTLAPSTLFTTMLLANGAPLSPVGSDAAMVIGTIAGRTAVYRVALSGPESCRPLTPTDSGHFLIDADAGHILWFHSDHNTPADLWIANSDGGSPRRLTALHDTALAKHPRPIVEHLGFAAADGTPLDAWLVLPAGASGPVPMVLDIHGGPQCAWGPGFWHFAQALAARGIATLMPNPRGSASFGDAFAAAIQGSFARPADGDVLAAVDAAVARGLADPDRLGLAGISYGGYLSAWLLGQTTRFRAAIPEQLISNLVSMHGTSDIGRELVTSRLETSIAGGFATIWDNSPLAHAHKATTPTLIIQCEDDVRCPMGQAEEFFVALREAGCTVEFLRIPGSSHAAPQLAGIAALSRARDEPALDWFTRHLLSS